MGLKDLMWATSPVGKIAKNVALKFRETDDEKKNSAQFKLIMNELGYYSSSEKALDDILSFIKGNPLLFIYYLICIEYKKMPGNLDDQTESIAKYICKKFDSHNSVGHERYISGVTYKDYNWFIGDCKQLLAKLHFGI